MRSTRRSGDCSRWRTRCRARSPQHLHRWVQGGPYAAVFDDAEDTLTFQRVQCFEFQGLEDYPLVLEPLLFYVLHRANAVDSRPGGAQPAEALSAG